MSDTPNAGTSPTLPPARSKEKKTRDEQPAEARQMSNKVVSEFSAISLMLLSVHSWGQPIKLCKTQDMEPSTLAMCSHAKEDIMAPILLWLLGVPLSVVILLMLFGLLH